MPNNNPQGQNQHTKQAAGDRKQGDNRASASANRSGTASKAPGKSGSATKKR